MKDKYREASACSVNCFCWQQAIISKAKRDKDYAQEDLVLMSPYDDCHNLTNILERAWNAEIVQSSFKKRKPSILRAFCRAFSSCFMCLTFIGFIS